MRRKAVFRSNNGRAVMLQFACLQQPDANTVYMPLHGFTAVDPGYQQGNAVSNMVNKMDEASVAATAIRSIMDDYQEREIDTLFRRPSTTTLVNPIAGLDDFELIAFLVVGDGGCAARRCSIVRVDLDTGTGLRLTGKEATLERMTVELKPETERLLREEIENGHVTTVDELIVFAVQALRERDKSAQQSAPRPRRTLYDLLTQPPFAGCELNLDPVKDSPRPVDL